MISTISNIIPFVVMGILFLFGIVVTAMARRDHGSAAMIGMAGCILLLLGLAFNIFRSYVLFPQMSSAMDLQTTLTVTNLVSLLLDGGGTALLIWAVVARRKPRTPATQPQPGPGWQQPQQPPAGWQQQPQQPPYQQPGWQNPPQGPYGGGQS
ncbi:hypothetical protein ACIBQ1_32165 [Nonomuraea sp. NPDC050153]|uniref:hypothetical protein n=1 Tax=Nonomuraea sp. NPDC050153 TaxID=3364359 RepID=UPI0037BD20A4